MQRKAMLRRANNVVAREAVWGGSACSGSQGGAEPMEVKVMLEGGTVVVMLVVRTS